MFDSLVSVAAMITLILFALFGITWAYFFAREMIREVISDFRARRRGEKRIASRGMRGRVYARGDGTDPIRGDGIAGNPGDVEAKAEPQAFISARHYIAAEDRWVDLGVIADPDSVTVARSKQE